MHAWGVGAAANKVLLILSYQSRKRVTHHPTQDKSCTIRPPLEMAEGL